jgi:uncharacterized membrane protein YidH (DUF202 family)
MMIPEAAPAPSCFRRLVIWGFVSEQQLEAAEASAAARNLGVETVLLREHGAPKRALLQALSEHTGCPPIEYDERMPVPAELLAGLDEERLSASRWVPVIGDGDEVVIATSDPANPAVAKEARAAFPGRRCTFRVALDEDVGFYIEDFLHAPPGLLIGTERTGLAHWRNTMALWRTRLACYRTDYAKAKTHLALLRWGLGLVGLSDALMHARGAAVRSPLCWALVALGASFSAWAIRGYLRVRRVRIEPPGHHTLVEVTAATISFLERYHVAPEPPPIETKRTMLARLGDLLTSYCTVFVPPVPASRERTHLARERNALAAQRTIAACHRTLYARSRTGLALVRTGVAVAAFGLGLIQYFEPSTLTVVEATLVVVGVLMVIDGGLWHLPVREEVPAVPRCAVL